MGLSFRPLHLLAFTEAFAHDLVDRGFHKTRRDHLTMAISLAVIWDQVRVVSDVRAKLVTALSSCLNLG